MSDMGFRDETHAMAPTQAALGDVKAGTIRHAIAENVQVNADGIIPPFSFKPPGGVSGWLRVRISNYTPYLFQVIGIPGGGPGDPPQMIQPFQQNVWNYKASRGTITLMASEEGSPLAVPPIRFAYGAGTATGDLLYNFVTVEWTDTPDLFFGYYPVPLVGISIAAETLRVVSPLPTIIPVGADPVAIAVDETRQRAYVANATSQTITVIDTAVNSVVTTIVMSHTPTDVAVERSTGRVYVTFSDEPTVAMFQDNIHIGSVNVGDNQKRIATNPITHKKYATLAGGGVAVLSNVDVHTGNIAVGTGPVGVAVNEVTDQIYVANLADDTVSQIDGATGLVVGIPIVVGNGPIDLTCDTVLNRIYVANSLADTVTHINGVTALVVGGPIAVSDDPVALKVNDVTSRVYVANNGTNSVSVIDETVDLVIDTLAPGVGPTDLAVNGINDRVYVTLTADVVAVLDGV